MSTAYYMKFKKGHYGSKNRVGGQPTYIPNEKPWNEEDDIYFGFLMEFWIDNVKLILPNLLCIQIYQTIDEGDDPLPEVVLIKPDAELNNGNNILVHPDAKAYDIDFEELEDPDDVPEITMEHSSLFKSKLGGFDPWRIENPDMTFLGQISEMPLYLNFGGLLCSLYLDQSGNVLAKLH